MRRLLMICIFMLFGCGPDEQQEFEINGELKSCTILEVQNCGLRVACDDDRIYWCVTN